MKETKQFNAIIIRSSKRVFDCKNLATGEIIQATAMAALFKDGHIVVGDEVVIEGSEDLSIVEVVARKSEIFRMNIREGKKKIIASNCDVLVIISSVAKPSYKRGLVDRYLVRAAQWNIPALVIFNKIDVMKKGKYDIQFEEQRLSSLKVKCFEISAKYPDVKPMYIKHGIEDLKHELLGKKAIFLGQSGVGKSRLITTLTDSSVQLKSAKIGVSGKGVHTTTWCELIDKGSFSLIDSPGIRSLSLNDLLIEELIQYLPDVEEIAVKCKFNNCEHHEKAKGCAFYSDEMKNSKLYDQVLSRLESYLKIYQEVSAIPSWKKK